MTVLAPFFGLTAAFLLLSGCAASYEATSTPIAPQGPEPKRVLIAITATTFSVEHGPSFYDAVERRLSDELALCGVQSESMLIAKPALLELALGNPAKEAELKIEARSREFQPDHILRLDQGYEKDGRVFWLALLTEGWTYKMVWRATVKSSASDMPFGFSNHGDALARTLVAQLVQDNRIHNCAPKP